MQTNIYAPVITSVDSVAIDAAARYGIKSSLTEDQTVAFQTMADDISAGNGGARTVILPAGEFHVSGTIDFNIMAPIGFWPTTDTEIQGHGGLTIVGQGMYATKIIQDTAGIPTFRFYQPEGDGTQTLGLTLEKFSMVGQGMDDTAGIGLQLGGVSPVLDILFMTAIRDVLITNFSTNVVLDDCTNVLFERCLFEGFNYGVEFGFNTDIITFLQCGFGSQILPLDIAATTDGSTAVVTSVDTTRIVAGMRIVSTAFPQFTTVLTVDSETQLTASANSTGVVSTISVTQGTALSFGYGPFQGARVTPSAWVSGNGNAISLIGCWFLKINEAINLADNTVHNIKFDSCYYERLNRISTVETGEGNGTYYLIFDNCHVSQPGNFQDYVFYEELVSAGTGTTVIRNCRCDGTSDVPWVRLDSTESRLEWDNNILNVSSGGAVNIFSSSLAYTPITGEKFLFGISGLNADPIELGVTGSLAPHATPKADCTMKVGPMTGNITIDNAVASIKNGAVEGQKLRFIFEQDSTGSRTVSWGTDYIGIDGAHLEVANAWTESTAADEFCIIEFMWDGTRMLQTTPANVWL